MSNNELILIPNGSNDKEIETSIGAFNEPLSKLLKHNGLPTEGILMPINERRKVIFSLSSVLEILPYEKREKAFYLSKFTVAITAGIFDGALNFIWNETIKSLRMLVINFDLQYFFNVAESLSNRYKNLSNDEELEAISDFDLLEICRRMGLLSDINHKRLEQINYLRNHASAAHPNDNQITGFEIISVLENCIKYAINASPDHSVIQMKRLYENIRKITIPDSDFSLIGSDLAKQPQVRIDDFLVSIFGIYCDNRQEQHTRNNIEKLSPFLWELATDDCKYRIGSKYGVYRKNADVDKKNSSERFLEIVKGLKYKDEDSLAAELIEKLQDLRTVHFQWNNFYNEYQYAESISNSLPNSKIPKAAKRLFVKIICICYVGNGKGYREGVDERALQYYIEFLKKFDVEDVKEFINLFNDNEFVTDLDKSIPDRRMRHLSKEFKKLTSDTHINKVLDIIINYPANSIQKISLDSKFKETIRFIK